MCAGSAGPGDVRRSFDVSAIQQEGIRAAFENGVLVLTLPKASAVKPERREQPPPSDYPVIFPANPRWFLQNPSCQREGFVIQ